MFFSALKCLMCLMVMTVSCQAFILGTPKMDAITFVTSPGKLFLPVHEAAGELKWVVHRDDSGRVTRLNGMEVPVGSLRTLTDGTELVSVDDLQRAGAAVSAPTAEGAVTVGKGWRRFVLRSRPQKVEVSLRNQQLQGWQGDRLVLKTRISSGKNGATPAGEFKAGPYRAKMHRSSLYNNAPMPWSVQINGHVFVHGYSSVPSYPASHGCVRVPLTEGNPARFFYEWVQTGTPVSVVK
jgi:lipoprotein-anchoring transpeptidase ErfK/SrfK